MNEEIKNENIAENATPNQPVQIDPKDAREKLSRGTLTLLCPIRARGRDVTELKYDFTKLTGMEYANAMASARHAEAFTINTMQAFHLFCATAAKENPDVATVDIMRDMKSEDAVKAVQAAQLFFELTSRAGNKRVLNGSAQ